MRLLLDTHALLWWLADEGLTEQARDAIADPANLVILSAASAWEISIKKALGKLSAPDDLEQQAEESGFSPLPITIAHALAAGRLPRHHDDPFDRMLIAQAFAEGLTIVTHDKRFADYNAPTLPA
jgi:PIN domain nuclease of toxin-antitoxin system